MAELVVDHLTKRFGEVCAVNDLSFTVADREFMVLIGPSGCGKSTTLNIIAGLETVTEGRISINGRQVNDLHPKDRDIAMVFQNYALYPHMNVYRNMAFGLRMRKFGKKEIDRRVIEAAEILGIRPLLSRKPRELSGGQRQRVAVGRAIVRKPAVFLFDEPLSNLDAKLRVQMREELIRLHRKLSATIVYVTHDQVEAMTMADRIVILEDGCCRQIGSPMALYNKPSGAFVAGFIGTPPMNLLEGRLHRETDPPAVITQSLRFPIPAGLCINAPVKSDRSVYFGVRPEDIRLTPPDGPASDRFAHVKMEVEIVETLGSHLRLILKREQESVVAVTAPDHRLIPGQTVDVFFDMEKMHLFAGEKPYPRIGPEIPDQ